MLGNAEAFAMAAGYGPGDRLQIGFDTSPQVMSGFVNGYAHLTSDQQPFLQGTRLIDQFISRVYILALERFPQLHKAKFAEWWAHCRPHCSGHQMHYDSVIDNLSLVGRKLARPTDAVATNDGDLIQFWRETMLPYVYCALSTAFQGLDVTASIQDSLTEGRT